MHLFSFQKKAPYCSVPRLVLAVAVPTYKHHTKTTTAKTNRGTPGYAVLFESYIDVIKPSDSLHPSLSNVSKVIMLRFSMGNIIRNISRVDHAVCWPDFTAPYSTKPSAELSSRFRLNLSCCSTTLTIDEVQWYTGYAIKLVTYALVHVMLSYLLCTSVYSKYLVRTSK